jgi:hypothetical protein
MSEMEQHLRKELGHAGPQGPLDAAPVESALAWLARQPAGPAASRDALPIATRMAQNAQPNDVVLRTNATRLVGRLYPLTEPVTPASVAFDPNAKPETVQRYKDERSAYRKRGIDTLLALSHDPAPTVAAAAAIELLANTTAEERRALRPQLQSVEPTLEAALKIPEVAAALAELRGPPQVARWLADYAAHKPIPVKVDQLAEAVQAEPSPDSLAALESAIVADPTFRDPSFEPKTSAMANTLKLPVYDADTERLQQMLAAIHHADPARAQAIAERAPPKLSARLRAFLSTRPKPVGP